MGEDSAVGELTATLTVDGDALERVIDDAEAVAWNSHHGRRIVADRAGEFVDVDTGIGGQSSEDTV